EAERAEAEDTPEGRIHADGVALAKSIDAMNAEAKSLLLDPPRLDAVQKRAAAGDTEAAAMVERCKWQWAHGAPGYVIPMGRVATQKERAACLEKEALDKSAGPSLIK